MSSCLDSVHMNGIPHLVDIFLILTLSCGTRSDVVIKRVECYNEEGTDMDPTEYNSVAEWPSTHTLRGCGVLSTGEQNDQIKGTSIEDNQCKVWTHYNFYPTDDDFSRAYARCCDFSEYGSSFITTQWSENLSQSMMHKLLFHAKEQTKY